MEIIDISRDLIKTPVYSGDPEGYVDPILNLRSGDNCNLNSIYTCLHTATHVDAPLHFIFGFLKWAKWGRWLLPPFRTTILSPHCGQVYTLFLSALLIGTMLPSISHPKVCNNFFPMTLMRFFKGNVFLKKSCMLCC